MIQLTELYTIQRAFVTALPAKSAGKDAQTKKATISAHIPVPPLDLDEWFPAKSLGISEDLWSVVTGTRLPYMKQRSSVKAMVEVKDSACPLITDRMQIVLGELYRLLDRAARIYGVQVSKVVVSGFVDPEEDRDQIVVSQWVNLQTRAALEYWDKVGLMVETWIGLMPAELSSVAVDRLAIEVEWNIDATALRSA